MFLQKKKDIFKNIALSLKNVSKKFLKKHFFLKTKTTDWQNTYNCNKL